MAECSSFALLPGYLISGAEDIHDTRAAVLWDEEPNLQTTLTERDAPIYQNNDVELFIAGPDTYYEFEINAFGTIYEVLFIWDESYIDGGYDTIAGLSCDQPGSRPFHGVGYKPHPRGPRIGYWNWNFPGLQSAVFLDGTINDDQDIWRMDFSRLNQYKEAPPADDSGGWAWSPHGVWDSHVPECFTYIHFSTDDVISLKQK